MQNNFHFSGLLAHRGEAIISKRKSHIFAEYVTTIHFYWCKFSGLFLNAGF